MRRLYSFLLVFLLGAAVGRGWLSLSTPAAPDDPTARRLALAALDKQPQAVKGGDSRLVEAIRRIEPSVVNIDTVGRKHVSTDENGTPVLMDREMYGKGSGVILSPDGFIVTNNHVVEGTSSIRVTLQDGRWYNATLVGRDPRSDLAVVRIAAAGLLPADLGDSRSLEVGECAIAVGNPLGLSSSATVGIISALGRRNLRIDSAHMLEDAIQTDAPINKGNSGGALCNIAGQVVGINTAILSSVPDGGSIGLGFALPINTVRRVARDIIANSKAIR